MNLEVWFQQQDQASVFLESSVIDSDEERFYETSLFALFAARQIANLRGDLVARSLASALLDIDVDRPLEDVREKLGEVQLLAPSTRGGRKGFTAEFRPEKRAFFKMHIHGMGFLGKGAGYYAPTSTLALLAYLLDRRSDDGEYQYSLAATAHFIGMAGSQGAITVTSQAQIAMQAAAAGWAMEAERASDLPGSSDGDDDRDALVVSSATAGSDATGADEDVAQLLAKEPVVAEIGNQVLLRTEDEIRLGFRAISLHDPIEPTKDSFGAERGHRYVGVEIEVENLSRDEEAFSLLTAALVDDEGEAYEPALATRDPEFDVYPDLEPGERSEGFLLFEMHKHARPQRFVIGIDDTPAAAAWTFAPDRAPDSAETDTIEQIRRLAELRDQGILTDDEFETKKAELLDRL